LRSGALCSWTGTVATTHTAPEVVEGLAVGAAVRAGEVAVAPPFGEDPGRPQAVPAARPTTQMAIGTPRIIRLTSALE
jgi:hypothetical protein